VLRFPEQDDVHDASAAVPRGLEGHAARPARFTLCAQENPMPDIVKKRTTPSPVMLAFAAALAAAPAVAPSAHTLSVSASATDSTQIVPSPAALERMNTLSLTMLVAGPKWIELWPEVTHVETVK
jgi:hypothetical protein